MEASGSNVPQYDDEEKALKGLLDAFSSTCSLDEIASAYCKAGRNADLAAEVLYDMQGSGSTSTTNASNFEVKEEESSESSCGNFSEKLGQENGNPRAPKQKSRPVSGGTVSSILGKDYIRSTSSSKGSYRMSKPSKPDSSVMLMSELSEVEAKSGSPVDDPMHWDMEDFLFRMLGDGFKVDRNVIREVIDYCGTDMQKFADKGQKAEVSSHQGKLQYANHPRSNGNGASSINEVEPPGKVEEKNGLQKEVLVALFNAPERHDEFLRRTTKAVKRYAALEQVVDGPIIDDREHRKTVTYLQKDNDDIDDEDSYQVLRKAVKEYRGTMKEYYKAALDAFSEGNPVKAGKLLDQGHFFHEKACEADEESNRKIFESRNDEAQDEMTLDLHDLGAKDALRLLKRHLLSFSGIPSFKSLKVILETKDEDATKGSRRRMVMKLLEKESIAWTEEENAGTILIHLNRINRKRLSFVKK
ncbi:putative nuclear RNA export factor SDE5 isoform X2 [Carya illinoinensis]|uniref:putative nuclear RNA export factor SDE5 isoform X2 n=1 Tax=Carya illinoinensis TaxID=32201 RepID=UPI001C726E37|nr:putative nuclear RNA export factor SDE5 isoform X2 [Carya illinoinensis]